MTCNYTESCNHEVYRIQKSVLDYAIPRKISVRRDGHNGYYFIRDADGNSHISMFPTAKSALTTMRRFVRYGWIKAA